MRDPKVSLPEAPKLTLEQVGQERHYGARKRVVEQGQPSEAFYVVESGRLRVFLESPEGIQTELNKLGPGDYFGEMGMVTRLPRAATVETLEETVLREIPQPEFDRLLDQNPELARHIIRQLSYWLVKGDLRLSRVTQEEVKKRQISWVDYLLILGLGLILGSAGAGRRRGSARGSSRDRRGVLRRGVLRRPRARRPSAGRSVRAAGTSTRAARRPPAAADTRSTGTRRGRSRAPPSRPGCGSRRPRTARPARGTRRR